MKSWHMVLLMFSPLFPPLVLVVLGDMLRNLNDWLDESLPLYVR